MRQLVADPTLQQRLAIAGASAVRERLSPERLGAIVRQRLGSLLLHPSRRELHSGLSTPASPLG
jgi:hypothetical protein